jgi:VCBS repeat-containing protein
VTLTMAASGWNPVGASTYLTLLWNRQNDVLDAGDSVSATFTLTVASDTGSLTTFSCSVTITGTE